jgi:hypothetical protein
MRDPGTNQKEAIWNEAVLGEEMGYDVVSLARERRYGVARFELDRVSSSHWYVAQSVVGHPD